LVAWPAGASASTTSPGREASVVESISPATDAIAVRIIGGDTAMGVSVKPGHSLVVLGYDGEPYLRVEPDGTVQTNRSSPTLYSNVDRYGTASVPKGLDSRDAPKWETISDSGDVVWHDHRVHWMTPGQDPAVDSTGTIQTWSVPLVVDGTRTAVSRRLSVAPTDDPWIHLAVSAAAIACLCYGFRNRAVAGALIALAGASIAAAASAVGEWMSLPSSVERSVLVLLLPLLSVVLVVAAGTILVRVRHREGAGQQRGVGELIVVGVVSMTGWLVLRTTSLWQPVLVTSVDPRIERMLVTVALAGTVSAIVAVTAYVVVLFVTVIV
jgi:hypothetical protein